MKILKEKTIKALINKDTKHINIYLLSYEKITEGCWVLFDNSTHPEIIGKVDYIVAHDDMETYYDKNRLALGDSMFISKIIASTDDHLRLPTFPKSFINLFKKKAKKGKFIESIFVNYLLNENFTEYLNVTNNEVIIQEVFFQDLVNKLLKKAWNASDDYREQSDRINRGRSNFHIPTYPNFKRWLSKTLKKKQYEY